MEKRSTYIDQWRGICVLMVILNHLIVFRFKDAIHFDKGPTVASQVIAKLSWFVELWGVHSGTVGVCVFFCISGYLITLLMLKEETRNGKVSLRAFYVRRVCRIFPAMIVYVAAAALLAKAGVIAMAPHGWIAPLSLVCNTEAAQCESPFAHFWTLAIEEQFYLIWPVLMIFSGRRWRTAFVTVSLVVSLVLSPMPEFFVRGWISNSMAISCLSCGVLFALSTRFRSLFAWARVVPAPAFFAVLCLLAPFVICRWADWQIVSLRVLPLLVVTTVLAKSGDVFSSARLSSALNQIGLLSFSIYLWHFLATMRPGAYLMPGASWVLWFALPAAWFSYRFVELRFMAIGQKWSKQLQIPALSLDAQSTSAHVQQG